MSVRSRRSRSAPGSRDRRRPSTGKVLIGGVPSVVPPNLAEGQVRCPLCRNGVAPTASGRRLRRHRDLFPVDCPNVATGEAVVLDEIPPVVLPTRPGPKRPPRLPRPKNEPSRLDVGSECQGCGKWIPGERRLCGRCFALRGN